MNLDSMRQEWKSLDISDAAGRVTSDAEFKVRAGQGVTTYRERLQRMSRLQIAVCIIGMGCMLTVASVHPVLAVLVEAFFFIIALTHFMQMKLAGSIDVTVLTVKESIEGVYRIERLRLYRRVVGVIIAVPTIVYGLIDLADSYGEYMLPMCIAGVLAGCVVGYVVSRRTTRLLRDMKRQVGE